MKNEKKSRGVSEMLQGALDGIEQGVEALHEQHPWLQQMSEQVADVYTKTRNNISHTSAYIQDFMGLKKN
jgi:nucleoside-triphosphatase THEP1